MSLWRIHIHWTAGAPGIVDIERDSYHFIVSRSGEWSAGSHKPEDNIPPLRNHYAAHTRSANSYAIGVALDAMHDAKERPFDPGPFPITWPQIEAMTKGVADLCRKYGVPVTRDRVLSHAEVQRTLGIRQNAKWDVTWLPDMARPGDPIDVGDRLRAMIAERLVQLPPPAPEVTPETRPDSWWNRVRDSWFG